MIIEIKHKFTNSVLCSFEAKNIKDAVQKAAKCGANLFDAELGGLVRRD